MNKKQETKLIVRVAGRDVDGTKPVERAVRKIRGVNFMLANAAVKKLGIKGKKVGDMKPEQLEKLESVLKNPKKHGLPAWMHNRRKDYDTGDDKHLLEADLEIQNKFDIRRMMEIKSRRGLRHSRGLKVRGQKTKAHPRSGGTVGVKRKKIQLKAKKKRKAEKKGGGKK